MADETILVEVKYDTKDAQANINALTGEITSLEDANKNLKQKNKENQKQLIDLAKQGKQNTDEYKRLNKEIKDNNIQIEKNTEKIKSSKQVVKNNIQLIQSEEKSIKRLKLENKLLIRERENLNRNSKNYQRNLDRINTKITENNKIIRTNAGLTQKSSGFFKNLAGSLKNAALGFFGITAAIGLAIKVLKEAFTVAKNFEKANAELAGVLGVTSDKVKDLRQNAIDLGSTTAKSASEVTKLQIAYARLGFTQNEIIDLTKGTIDGSIALNAELENTAELTGAVVNSFDEFEAKDAGHILDVLTLSTQKSALNFEKLSVAIPIIAGAAAGAGVSFETMTDQLAQAADRGIDASTSATSLRNIYLELAKKGLTLEQAFAKINSSQDKLSVANELFGKRAAVTALALAANANEASKFKESLDNVAGTAEKVANVQLDTLEGDLQLLRSAWEGFILSTVKTEGARKLVQALTKAVSRMSDEIKTLTPLWQVLGAVIKVSMQIGLAPLLLMIDTIKLATRAIQALAQRDVKALKQAFKDGLDDVKGRFQTIFETTVDAGKQIVKAFNTKPVEDLIKEQEKLVESNKKIVKTTQEIIESEKELEEKRKKSVKKQLDLIDQNFEKEIQKQKDILLNDNSIGEKRVALNQSIANKILDIEIQRLKSQLKISQLSIEEREKIEQKLFNLELKLHEQKLALQEEDKKNEQKRKERIETAEEKINEIRQGSILAEIEDLEERKKKIIQFEQEEFERKLENKQLLDEEIELLELEHQQRIDGINQEFDEKQRERLKEQTEGALQSFDTILESAGMFKDQRLELGGEILNGIQKLSEKETITVGDAFDLMGGFASKFTAFRKNNFDQELNSLYAERDAELAKEGLTEAEREKINKDFAQREFDLKKQQFEAEKKKSISDTIIQGSIAVAKAIAAFPVTGGLPASAIVAGLVAAQVGKIRSEQFPGLQTLEKGGKMALFGGNRHSMGGTKLWGSDGSRLEVEKGESAFVLNRTATAQINALSAINERYGGNSFRSKGKYMQDGGQADLGFSEASISIAIKEALQDLNLSVSVEDIKNGLENRNDVINVSVI